MPPHQLLAMIFLENIKWDFSVGHECISKPKAQ
jgi:hypothetical protein